MRRGGPRPAHHIGEIEGVHNHEKTSDEMVDEIIGFLDHEYSKPNTFTRIQTIGWVKNIIVLCMADFFRPAGGVDIDNIDHNSSRRDLCGFVLDRLRASAETDKKQIYIAAVTRLLGVYEQRLHMLENLHEMERVADLQNAISDKIPRRQWSNPQRETKRSPKEPGGPVQEEMGGPSIHPHVAPVGVNPGIQSIATLQTIDRFITLMAQYVKP